MAYHLLTEFQRIFEGHEYRHRSSTKGDTVAIQLFEDLFELGRSKKLVAAIEAHLRVRNRANRQQGRVARRGDATFGEIIPGERAKIEVGSHVAQGPVATIEIGAEVKILAKAMIKQIDRVISDLTKQVHHFKRSGGNPICIGIVGINSAPYAIGLERERSFHTDGKANRHPIQEAAAAEQRLRDLAAPDFDEFLFLRYRATNDPNSKPPFPFEWVDFTLTNRDYGAILTRVSIEYEKRF
jgi:hypothetical protein